MNHLLFDSIIKWEWRLEGSRCVGNIGLWWRLTHVIETFVTLIVVPTTVAVIIDFDTIFITIEIIRLCWWFPPVCVRPFRTISPEKFVSSSFSSKAANPCVAVPLHHLVNSYIFVFWCYLKKIRYSRKLFFYKNFLLKRYWVNQLTETRCPPNSSHACSASPKLARLGKNFMHFEFMIDQSSLQSESAPGNKTAYQIFRVKRLKFFWRRYNYSKRVSF